MESIKFFDAAIKLFEKNTMELPRDFLDPTVFQTFENGAPPILKDSIKAQICKDIDDIQLTMPVIKFFIAGDILGANYEETSPIKIYVQVDGQYVDTISSADVLSGLKHLNGRLATGTTHPIRYFVIINDDQIIDKAVAAYDIANDRWLKLPPVISAIVTKIMSDLRQTLLTINVVSGKFDRNLISLEDINDLKNAHIKEFKKCIKLEIVKIDDNISHMIEVPSFSYRALSYEKISLQDILSHCNDHNYGESVKFKILEKYYYIKMLNRLDRIMEERSK